MPKKRQIPRLFSRQLANGLTTNDWKPSKTLRDAGFVNVELGTDFGKACARALELNAQVEAWKNGSKIDAVPVAHQTARIVRFGELIRRYRKSDAFTALRTSTRAEYNTRLNQLERWALDGELAVRSIDRNLVRDLRNELVKGSPFVAAGTLRMLRLVLYWAVDDGIIAINPAAKIKIPETPRRRITLTPAIRLSISEAARELGLTELPLAIELGFWALQREADILSWNRMAWREVENVSEIDSRHVAVLADRRGRVMTFRFRQHKTGVWIDAPIPPALHAEIEAAMAASPNGWLFQRTGTPELVMHEKMFQRRFKEARDAAVAVAIMEGDMALAEAIDACKFRDLRRTGMTFYGNNHVRIQSITALSGHAVLGKKTILDDYMPGNIAGACACVAQGLLAMEGAKERKRLG